MLLDERRSPWSTPPSDTCTPLFGNRNHKPLHEFHRQIADSQLPDARKPPYSFCGVVDRTTITVVVCGHSFAMQTKPLAIFVGFRVISVIYLIFPPLAWRVPFADKTGF